MAYAGSVKFKKIEILPLDVIGLTELLIFQKKTGKVIAYMRTATGQEGLRRQKERIIEYVSNTNLRIDEFWKTEGKSDSAGFKARRIDEFLSALNPGDILITTDPSRLSRNAADLFRIFSRLARKKVTIIFTL